MKTETVLCPTCKKPMHWRHVAKINGQSPQKRGRPRSQKRDDDKIMSLRESGMSLREIALRLGISIGMVQRSLK